MSKIYEQLIAEINEVAVEAFHGREFKAIRSIDSIEPEENFDIGQIIAGSERHLSGEDKAVGGTVDVTEQYMLKNAGGSIFLAEHCLEIAWGNYNEDEIVTVDLDRGELNDANGYRYMGEAALSMAEHVLGFLQLFRPTEASTVSETDLSEFDQYLTDAAEKSEQLASSRMSVAVADNLVGYVAMKQNLGEELSEEKFDVFVKTIKLRHGLTEAEVDKAVDLRMQEIMQAESSPSPKQ
ncbi:MAG: hypothetical protein ACREGB_00350 [Candidatus Saccharimonadales bacterium]